MSVHKHIKKQKIYQPNRQQGKSLKYWLSEGLLTGYSGYIFSSTGFDERLKSWTLIDGQLSKL